MAQYYFLGISLPELYLEHPPAISFQEFEQRLHDNLFKNDLHSTETLRIYYDLENLRAIWKQESLDSYGNFDASTLREKMELIESLPPYVGQYIEQYAKKEDLIQNFAALIAAYFREEIAQSHGFLKSYLQFERKLRLIQTAFRAKSLQRDLPAELQFEDPEEPFLQQLLVQKDAADFSPPEEFEDLIPLLEKHKNDPLELHQAFNEYRLQKVRQMDSGTPFSIDCILAYMIQLMIIERRHEV